MTYEKVKEKTNYMLDLMKSARPEDYLGSWMAFYNHTQLGDFSFMDKKHQEWSKKVIMQRIEKETA